MATILCQHDHILQQARNRYHLKDPQAMLARVMAALQGQAPADWRFTQSPAARFFVVDLETQVKILGVSYREWGQEIVQEFQQAIQANQVAAVMVALPRFIKDYVQGFYRPDLAICHDLVTAYPPQKGEIGEKKRILAAAKEQLEHAVPLQEKKLAARPNAIVVSEAELWVRQHLNWVNLRNPNKEFYFCERLTPKGINKTQRRIFSYTSNGTVRPEAIPVSGCPLQASECYLHLNKPPEFGGAYRTDAYWTLPTYLDRRLLDLDFRERQPDKADDGPLHRDEVVELYLLRRLVQAARSSFL